MSELRECPLCGSEVWHDSTELVESVICTLCPYTLVYNGSYEALKAMHNNIREVQRSCGVDDQGLEDMRIHA